MFNLNIKCIDNAAGKQTFSIQTSKLLPGVYFISLTGANGQNFKGKLVVIR
ncbi:MAG: T9SS type A sorting domain-containing protein [Bacteroidetes bacterium]|nr:T9SS type A sorting domain-containing protein [Bacteroidota bacterium]MBK9423579.1 T9SS type A sorting domain-containing protein [Bacteroidota bacterium]MBL0074064.1 T9SS type A sorting domain-containing protein [Bacteroidota bacterium]